MKLTFITLLGLATAFASPLANHTDLAERADSSLIGYFFVGLSFYSFRIAVGRDQLSLYNLLTCRSISMTESRQSSPISPTATQPPAT